MDNLQIIALFTQPITFPSRIGYYFDENVDQRLLPKLSECGITVRTVEQEGQKSETNDYLILAKARELALVLVTNDYDFYRINERINELWLTEGTTHTGIVYLDSGLTPGRTIDQLIRLHETRIPESMENLLLHSSVIDHWYKNEH